MIKSPAAKPRSALLKATLLAVCALSLASCASRPFASKDRTDPRMNEQAMANNWQKQAAYWRTRYEANPKDVQTALSFARALRGIGQKEQAIAVLQQIALRSPKDNRILAAYGKALVDAGRFDEATHVLAQAQTDDQPNWEVLSAQATVASQAGDNAKAQSLLRSAIQIAPNEPTLLANLGMSYALSQRLPDAEAALRKASENPRADVRIRENLAFVLGLSGKWAEAEAVYRRDFAPDKVAQNMAWLKDTVTTQSLGRAASRRHASLPDTPKQDGRQG